MNYIQNQFLNFLRCNFQTTIKLPFYKLKYPIHTSLEQPLRSLRKEQEVEQRPWTAENLNQLDLVLLGRNILKSIIHSSLWYGTIIAGCLFWWDELCIPTLFQVSLLLEVAEMAKTKDNNYNYTLLLEQPNWICAEI